MKTTNAIPLDAIVEARRFVYEAAVRTPLIRFDYPKPNGELYLKLESFQPIGSFKIRGAYNAVRRLREREPGLTSVWTVSAGNAAQGVAFAAKRAGIRCQVLIIETAPATKKDAVRALGAEIVERSFDECWEALQSRVHPAMSGAFVHPFDDDDFIAGNATAGLEILDDLPDVDCIVAPFGGGGLACGIASAMQALKPSTKVFGAEPETAAPLAASIAAGSAQYFEGWTASWVDGCGGKSVLPAMWTRAHELLAGSIVSSLDEIAEALRLVARRNHLIAEGAAACAVAAGLKDRCRGKTVCILSGGNIDPQAFCRVLTGAG